MKASIALALALVAGVIASYVPALQAGFVWNDNTYVTENATLDDLDGLRRIWTEPGATEQYYPLVFTSFWLEKQLYSTHPLGYHLVNVLLHAAAALLLWAFLRRLDLPGAFLAAAVFALHPVCVESVAWVTERKNTLSLVLSLLAAHAWLSWRAASEARIREGERKKRKRAAPVPFLSRPLVLYSAAFVAFTLALLAKTTASVLPPVLLVLVWWKHGRVRWADAKPLLPLFAVGAALGLYTAWFERTMVRATGSDWGLSLAGKAVLAGRAVVFYAGKALLPVDLAFIYPRWTIDAKDPWQWLPALGALCAAGVAAAMVRRVGRGPLASLLLFGGVLFPALGFFNVYAMRFSYVADHFAYQATAVGAAAVVCGAASLLARAPAAKRAAGTAAIAILVVLGTSTFRQSRVYRSEETLWRHTLEKNPACFMCETNFGYWLVNEGRSEEAIGHFEASLRIKPDNVPTLLNLAHLEEVAGRLDGAAAHLRAALAVDPSDPVAHLNLGVVLAKAGRLGEASTEFREALRTPSPDDYLAHNGLGVVLLRLGQPAEAIEHFQAVVRLRPDYAHGHANLARARESVNRPR